MDGMPIDAVAGRWRITDPELRGAMRVVFADGTCIQLIEVTRPETGDEFLVRGSPLNGIRNGRVPAMVVRSVPARTPVRLLADDEPVPQIEAQMTDAEKEWAALLAEQEAAVAAPAQVLAEVVERHPPSGRFVRPSTSLDVPVAEWANTSMKLPKPLVDTLHAEAERRVMGRNRMAAIIFEIGLANLPPLPEMPGGDV